MEDRRLIVLLKAPRPGLVKTRLAHSVGADAACAIYRTLVDTLARRLSSFANVRLCFTPDDAGLEVKPWAQSYWKLSPQGSGDLGARLQEAFSSEFRTGAGRVLVIGADCPEIVPADIETAWEALRSHDIALGPARDGGYWLVGLQLERPELFKGITWGGNTVLRETLDRCRDAKLRVHLLRELGDVDTEEDWHRYLEKLPAAERELIANHHTRSR